MRLCASVSVASDVLIGVVACMHLFIFLVLMYAVIVVKYLRFMLCSVLMCASVMCVYVL